MAGSTDNPHRLSLCMIVKDEEECLGRCLESVRGLVDEIIVVDTGSRDRTVKVAKGYGAKVFHHPWNNDFAEARNVSLSHATGEWILVLDADEVVSAASHPLIGTLLTNRQAGGYQLVQRSYLVDNTPHNWTVNDDLYDEGRRYSGYAPSPLVRLFRNDSRIRFEGRVHEVVEHSLLKTGLALIATDIPIHHFGKVRDEGRLRQKQVLYREIGLRKIQDNPRDARAHNELALQYLELDNLDMAEKHFRESFSIDPAFSDAYYGLGVTLARKNDPAGAIGAYRHVIELDPSHRATYNNLAVISENLGAMEDAEALFSAAAQCPPPHPVACMALGDFYRRRGRWKEAAENYEASLQLSPDDGRVLASLGTSYFKIGEHEKAARAFSRAAETNPSDANIFNNLGVCRAEAGDRQGAEAAFRKALELQPDHGDAQANLARLESGGGNERPRLSLCMIVKDEEGCLNRCLESVRSLVDEIIIVDTGSSDRSVEIAQSHGARVFYHPWNNDFAEARNVALSHATGEWILVLDADEVISARSLPAIRQLLADDTVYGYRLVLRNYQGQVNLSEWVKNDGLYEESRGYSGYVPISLVRLFRNDPRIRFEGKVHEMAHFSLQRHGLPIKDADIPIHHFGMALDEERMRQKMLLYRDIGEQKIRENPDNVQFLTDLGELCLKLEDLERADELFARAELLDPACARALFGHGTVFMEKGELGSALEYYQRVITVDPSHLGAYNNLADIAERLGAYDEAEGFYLQAVRCNAGYYVLQCNLAGFYERRGRLGEALECYENALASEPSYGMALFGMGRTVYRLGEFSRAAVAFERLTEVDASDPDVWHNLGVCREMAGDFSGAVNAYLKVLEIQPDHAKAAESLKQLKKLKTPFISLCMIAKNEERYIGRCLESVKGLVDEVVVVDTGSTDRTAEIAQNYGAMVIQHPWNDDFAEAKNVALASATGDWILVLDADEAIAARDHARIRELLQKGEADAYILELRNYEWNTNIVGWHPADPAYREGDGYPGYGATYLARLFRRREGVCYEGRVHELIEPSFKRLGTVPVKTGIPIHHYGRVREQERVEEKKRFYLRLGEEKAQEQGDAKAFLDLGVQYAETGEMEKGREALEKALELRPGYVDAMFNLGAIHHKTGRRAEALALFEEVLKIDPAHLNAMNNMAAALLDERRLEEAETTLKKVVALAPSHVGAWMNLGNVCYLKDDHEGALAHWSRVLELDPRNRQAEGNIAGIKASVVGKETGPIHPENGDILISLCMIAKNEEKYLPACLDSVRGLVDEIIVVDTGSSDRTMEIARNYGARVYEVPWQDDFSGPRNISLGHARGRWILVLDADEVIAERDKERLRGLVLSGKCKAYSFMTRNYCPFSDNSLWVKNDGLYPEESKGCDGWMESTKVRLFRRDRRVCFRGVIHELVEDSVRRLGWKIKPAGIPIHHYGRLKQEYDAKTKRQFYAALGTRKVAIEKDNPQAFFEKGTMADNPGEAAEMFRKAVTLKPDQPGAWNFLGGALIDLGQYDEAEAALTEALKREPRNPGAHNNKGLLCYLTGRLAEAREEIEKAIKLKPSYAAAYKNLGMVLHELGRPGEAKAAFERSLALNPGQTEIRKVLHHLDAILQTK